VVEGQDAEPAGGLGDDDQREEGGAERAGPADVVGVTEPGADEAQLHSERELGDGRCGAAEGDGRRPRVDEHGAFEVDAGEERAEGADDRVDRGAQDLRLLRLAAGRAERQQRRQRDEVERARDAQQGPPAVGGGVEVRGHGLV
jgi:hypothetical protein